MTSSATDVLAALPDADDVTHERLHTRLVTAADVAGLLDVSYRTIETSLGVLLLAATPRGLVRVAYEREGHELVLERLAALISPRILLAPVRLDTAAREIEDYLAGSRASFDLPLDLRLSSGFRRTVLTHLLDIPYGRTVSYTALAAAAGSARAVRAAGTACSTNPLPLVVPCHRVVRSDGAVGQYIGGPDAKRALLALEARRAGDIGFGHAAGAIEARELRPAEHPEPPGTP